jgi:Flp pilus assembly pilin Flp
MEKKMKKIIALFKEEEGVTALEYTVLAGLVIVVIVGLFAAMRGNITTIWNRISTALSLGAS